MKVVFGGYGEKFVAFETTEGALAGVPVMMNAGGAVAPCAVGKAFCGVTVNVRDGSATVQLVEYVRPSCTGTTLAVGYRTLVGDGVGKIKTDAVGRQLLVMDMDTSAAVCGVIL